MAIEDTIYAQMLAGQQQQQGFNPYSVPAQQIASANVYSPTSSTGANLLAGLIQGSASSIFGDLAQRRQSELNAAAVTNQRALLRQVQEDSLAQDLAKQQQRLGVEPQFQTVENQGQKQTYANYGQGLKLVGQQPIERQKSNSFSDQLGMGQPATFETISTVGPSATATPIAAEGAQGVDAPIDFRSQEAANKYVSKGLAARIAARIPVDANDKKALFDEYATQASSLDSVGELARIKAQLDEGIGKAGNTGLGLYSTVAEYGDKAAAGFLGAQSSIDKVTGSKLLDQAGSQIAMNFAKDTPGFAKLVDTDPGARLFLGPIKPGSDQTPEVNRQFSEGLGQTIAAKLDKQSKALGIPVEQLRAQTGTNTRNLDVYFGIKPEEIGGQNAGQNQGQTAEQDPQAAAVQALNIQDTATPSGAPTPAPTSPREVPFEAYAQTLPKPQETIPYVQKISEGLPEKMDAASPELMQRLFQAESSGNPKAKSPVGAKGLGQLMDATGKEVHKQLGIKEPYDPFNPQQNALIAETYLNQKLKENNGDVKSALAAYNAGQGSVNKAQKKTFSQYAQSFSNEAFQGLTFGYGDEALAGLKSKVGPIFGKSGNYDQYLGAERGQLDQFRQENPKAALAANIAGGAMVPMGAVAQAAKGVTQGAKAAPSIAKLAGLGAAQGALQGSGEAQGGAAERIKGAVVGGAIGSAGAGALGGAVKGVTALAKSDVVSNLAQKIANSSEIGAVGDIGKLKGKQVKEAASKGYQAVYKLLNKSDVSLGDLQAAATKVEQASNKGVPANLVSELAYDVTDKGTIITKNKPLVQRANTLRNTSGATKEATAILEEATSQSPERVKKIVGTLDPESKDVADAADKFLKGYKGTVADIKATRKAASDPLYAKARAETPIVKLGKLKSNARVGEALEVVRKKFPELESQADNSIDVLLESKRVLKDLQTKAKRDGENYIASKYGQARERLTKKIDNVSESAKLAAQTFAKESEPLNILEKGTLRGLKTLSDKQATPEKIADTLTKLTPREAEQLKSVMGPKYSKQVVSGLKSTILSNLDKTKDNTSDFVNKVIGSESQRKTIKILAGDDAYKDLMSSLAAEKKIVRLGQDTSRGSNTAEKLVDTLGNAEELTTLGKVANVVKSPVRAVGHIADYVGNIVSKSNAGTEREVVDLLLKQPQLQDFVNYYGKRKAADLVVDQVGSKASRAGSRTLNSSQVTYKKRK